MINLRISDFRVNKTMSSTDIPKEFEQRAHTGYAALLIGNGEKDISSWAYSGYNPHSVIYYHKGEFQIISSQGERVIRKDLFEGWQQLLDNSNYEDYAFPVNHCGGIGYLTYDTLHLIEKVKDDTEANYSMPNLCWVFYNNYKVYDLHENQLWEIQLEYENPSSLNSEDDWGNFFKVDNLQSECSEDEYKSKVEKIREYIFEGDVYEVNLSQQIRGDFKGNPYKLFQKLYSINDAPYSAFLNFGDHKIVCNSPEMFLHCEDRVVETRPIKGTIARGLDETTDHKNREILLSSKKDEAELFMIIDLLRNDIGKVCEIGSVKVLESKRLEAYQNVYHLIGIIKGVLAEENSYIDLIKATFPGGSITGCPKVRCMEIIAELESYKRNLYTGTVFIMNNNFINSNIVIRSGVITDDKIFFNSGGAVTIDSEAQSEFDEIQSKMSSLMKSVL